HRRLRPCDAADVGTGAIGEYHFAIRPCAALDLRIGLRGPQRARCASQCGEKAGEAEKHRARLAAAARGGKWPRSGHRAKPPPCAARSNCTLRWLAGRLAMSCSEADEVAARVAMHVEI